MNPSLSTSIGQIKLERPTILASGILGISLDVFNRIYRAGAGAVVTKSLSKEPWEGYPNPTIFSVNGNGWLNAVGLSNPGASYFAKMISQNLYTIVFFPLLKSKKVREANRQKSNLLKYFDEIFRKNRPQ